MIYSALAAWFANSLNGGGGAPGRDLRSIPSIHWSGMLSNMGDPLNLGGGSGSNVLANMANPAGFGAGPSWLTPNNNVNPSAQPGYASRLNKNPASLNAVPGGNMLTGISPQQQAALMAAYNNFSKNLGIPNPYQAAPTPSPAPAPAPGPVSPSPNYGAMQALSTLGFPIRAGGGQAPARGGGLTFAPQ